MFSIFGIDKLTITKAKKSSTMILVLCRLILFCKKSIVYLLEKIRLGVYHVFLVQRIILAAQLIILLILITNSDALLLAHGKIDRFCTENGDKKS